VFLAQIVIATALGVILSFAVEPVLSSSGATLIFVLLLAVAISEVVMARFVVSKQLAKGEEGAQAQAGVLASAFAGAIAVYGLIVGILAGHWYFVLPFGVIAFFAWQYLNRLVQSHEDTSNPYRFRSDP
jgi:hypothetical protein